MTLEIEVRSSRNETPLNAFATTRAAARMLRMLVCAVQQARPRDGVAVVIRRAP